MEATSALVVVFASIRVPGLVVEEETDGQGAIMVCVLVLVEVTVRKKVI